MKKYFILIFLLVSTFISNAQDYVPMAIENAQWVIYHTDDDGYPPFTDYYYNYRIEGEITINDVVYKKVFRRAMDPVNPDTNQPVSLPLNIGENHLYGAIRDDIPNRKVYGMVFCNETFPPDANYCDCDVEVLMFDFNMNIGDYYPDDCMFIGGSNFYLGEIVYQEIVNETRQVQRIYEPTGYDSEILRKFEGLGSNAGLFEVTCYFECNYNTYISHYCVGTDEECLGDYVLSTKEQEIINQIKIYPNPIIDKFTIDFSFEKNYIIEIFNLYGKRIFLEKIKNNTTTIDISKFNTGIYILKVDKNKIYKLIKK